MVSNVMLTLCFLAAVLLVYYITPKAWRWVILLLASYGFYMSVNPWMALLIGGSTVLAWFAGLRMEALEKRGNENATETEIKRKKRGWLLGSILPLLGVLFLFKYLNFFVESMTAFLNLCGIGAVPRTLQLILPLGISYYTFKLLSYIFDVYRGKIAAQHHLGMLALYTIFFPQILSGPIERASVLLPQFREPVFNRQLFAQGLFRIALGLFKKMVIANRLSGYVDTIFGNPQGYPALAAWMAAFFYAIQLYCDFSGYSDLALGMSDCMGIHCRENFRMPYFSTGIKEFWSRWHMSLSGWLKDYVYIPLGGSRVSKTRKNLNLMITFLVSGLWHGDNWTFLFWGAYHGFWNVLGKKEEPAKTMFRLWKTLVTFAGVTLGWIFFRAESLSAAFGFLKRMVVGFSLSYDAILSSILPFSGDNTCAALLLTVVLSILLLFVYEWQQMFGKKTEEKENAVAISRIWLVVFVVATALFGVFGNSSFLYAQF